MNHGPTFRSVITLIPARQERRMLVSLPTVRLDKFVLTGLHLYRPRAKNYI